MPSRELVLIVDTLRQAIAREDRVTANRAVMAGLSQTPRNLTYAPGDQVIDLVSGQKGVILAGERTTVITEAADRAAS